MFLHRVKLDTFRRVLNPVGDNTGLYKRMWSDHFDIMVCGVINVAYLSFLVFGYPWYSRPKTATKRFKYRYFIKRGTPVGPN